MIELTFPDGSKRQFNAGVTGAEVAESIAKSLAKNAVAMTLDGALADLADPIEADAAITIVTRDDPQALELIRHDAAHVMAEAVQTLFPGTQVTIGPIIENGFYYDFFRNEPFSTDDFAAIEVKMHEIIGRDRPFTKSVWPRDKARQVFEDLGEQFKVELVDAIPDGEDLRIYAQGDWFDLCRGPHMPSTGKIGGAFKLMKLAGAYWRGDAKGPQLQRIYGTAWRNERELRQHLTMLEEAEKRDHRRLGREMSLFHLQEEAPGMVFWHPKGWTLYRVLQDYMRRRLDKAGYREISTPQLMDRSFWEASGHWDKYREHMFIAEVEEEGHEDKRVAALKPMNCPCHVQIFNQGIKSYRDLPLRMAEFGSCHRYEPSGALHGLMRVRGFTQDDAHIFCTQDQITGEVKDFCVLLQSVYADLGFEDVRVLFADRPDVRVGSDAVWDRAEASLREAAEATGLPFEYNPGDGAFYGPKLDFVLKDAIGREWQTGTIQCDFNLPERLDASYVGEDGEKHRPVMLHRAILGSFERFIGVLIEDSAGRLPLWLAPIQAVVTTITSDADDYAKSVRDRLSAAGLRVEADLRNEKINYKVREHSVGKVPVILAVGGREVEERTVTIRRLGEKQTSVKPLDEVVAELADEAVPPDLR
ncbi:MAG TPA: threonine--tRNA ligase, partial [Afifellaceae bacterium]|nr:threonine--tRNA ligase [Afifellaceae bacterium]